ncbi:hypothetical protein [Mycobacterium intracellulare]|nr:hypothetical protein [Mycobacterium intracellulare]MEE3755359.1 hypothetical protein [Mycobacterium intracellulare]
MKIIILVEPDDDVQFAKQVAQDIPHQTYSASDIPIEVWYQSTPTGH